LHSVITQRKATARPKHTQTNPIPIPKHLARMHRDLRQRRNTSRAQHLSQPSALGHQLRLIRKILQLAAAASAKVRARRNHSILRKNS